MSFSLFRVYEKPPQKEASVYLRFIARPDLVSLIFLSFLFFSLILPLPTIMAAQLELSKNPDGWTVFKPSHDTRILYVSADGNDSSGMVYSPSSAAIGSDPFNPIGPINRFKTFSAAYANTRDGYPDWILIRRGDTFLESIGDQIRSGRSQTEPFLVASYGNSGLSPTFKTGSSNAIRMSRNSEWIAISGISFYAHTRNPDSTEFRGTEGDSGIHIASSAGYSSSGILLEGCKFRYYTTNVIGASSNSDDNIRGIVMRRCVILDNYSDAGHSQGLYSGGTSGLLLEENVFDHNGWYSYAGSGTVGEATMFNHNTYFASTNEATFRNNLFLRPSSSGNKFTAQYGSSGIVIDNNLYIDAGIGISIGTNYLDVLNRFENPAISNNVFVRLGYTNTHGSLSWGLWVSGWNGGFINRNLFLNNETNQSNAQTFYFYGHNRNIEVADNIVLAPTNANRGFLIRKQNQPDSTGMKIHGNVLEMAGDVQNYLSSDATLSGFDFSGNSYYHPTNSNYSVNGKIFSPSQWISSVENDSIFERQVFLHRDRNIATYMANIGRDASVAAFINAAREQDRYSWDNRFMPNVVNEWLRGGYFGDTNNFAPKNLRIVN